MKNTHLKGSTIVITGASSGIGKAAALAFAREGANIVLAARSETILQEIASECESLGGEAIAVTTDVTDKFSILNLKEKALEFYGSIDVWINNAGVGALGEFTITPVLAHEQVIKTNLLGPLFGCYTILPYFKSKGKGIIINTNSTGAYVGSPLAVSYSASKFGLRGLTEALRFELKETPGIHICDLYAPFVDSPGVYHAANYSGKEVKLSGPLVNPEKMAQAMVKLAKHPHKESRLGVAIDGVARLGHLLMPEVVGSIMNKFERAYFKKAKDVPKTEGNLFEPNYDQTSVHANSQ